MVFMKEMKATVRFEEETNVKILPYGARVCLTNIDKYGYNGRNLHPQEPDIGFTGVVVKMTVFDVENSCDARVGHPFEMINTEKEEVCYTVINALGRELECMGFEIETI